MSNPRTVFVVGAGASKELGLPVGSELRDNIRRMLDFEWDELGRVLQKGDRFIWGSVDECRRDHRQNYFDASQQIQSGLPSAISIDNYIDTHRDKPELVHLGKLAIAKAILEAEKNSLLRFNHQTARADINTREVLGTWYTKFLRLLTENRTSKEIGARLAKVTLIIFNYDRCIEHYLHAALVDYYHISLSEAEDLIRQMTILHPYGAVGSLPWQGGEITQQYGNQLRQPSELLKVAEQLITFSETTQHDQATLETIHSHIGAASKLVFLGFAYHRINMQLLFPKISKKRTHIGPRVYGSAFGISSSDAETIQEELLENLSPAKVHINTKLTCSTLFDEFWRSLSFS